MESRRNGPQLSSRHDYDDKITHTNAAVLLRLLLSISPLGKTQALMFLCHSLVCFSVFDAFTFTIHVACIDTYS